MSKKWWLALAALLVLAIGLAIGIPMLLPPEPGVTYANYSRIEKGMTRAQVKALLGEPSVERNNHWLWYSSPFNPILDQAHIQFDETGLVTEASWNGSLDGRTALEKLRDRLPWIAREPPGPMFVF